MAEQSCIKPLCDILVYSDERTTILKCLDGLENMLKAGEAEKNSEDVNPYCLLIEDAEGLEKISKLQMNKNDDIYEKAYKILVTNWLEEDDENNNNNVRCVYVDFQLWENQSSSSLYGRSQHNYLL